MPLNLATTLALPRLYDAVVARFALDAMGVPMFFGWRSPAQQRVGDNILWVPGDDAGKLGAMLPPKYPGRNPRSIWTLEEIVTIYISAADVSAVEVERAQYQTTRLLFDALLVAIHDAAHGTYRIVSDEWITTKNERRYGAAIRLVLAVQAPITGDVIESAPVDTAAQIATTELDVTETSLITAAP
jgi:hypothetical protein